MSDATTGESRDLKEEIRERYAERAREVSEQHKAAGCCSSTPSGCCGPTRVVPNDEFARGLYSVDETGDLPAEAVLASLGCGNPTALAELQPGEVVLDLGSGGGIDVLLSARRVGPTGKAYGLDMTDEMLALARENQREGRRHQRRVPQGRDRGPSRCPTSPSTSSSATASSTSRSDKDKVLAEAFRVLRPGGRFAVSDIVFQGDMNLVPDELLRDVEAWSGCIAGALEEHDYLARLERAGFVDAEIIPTTDYREKYGREIEQACGVSLPDQVNLVGAFVRATKPAD